MGSGQSTSSGGGSDGINKPSGVDATDNVVETPYTVKPTIYKKRALIIGINYRNTPSELSGCINDATAAKELLESWGFTTTLMTENFSNDLYPTASNILSKITSEIATLVSGDSLVIYYSGHGARVRDSNGDEVSGLDSVIVPVNYSAAGFIADDVIRSKLANAPSGSKVFAVFDSCNSASVCDLRFNLFDTSYRENPGVRDSELIVRNKVIENTNYANTNAEIYSLSGCRDDQVSIETSVNGVRTGALSYCLISYLKQATPNVSLETLISNVRSKLISIFKTAQIPQIMSGKEPNVNQNFADFLNI